VTSRSERLPAYYGEIFRFIRRRVASSADAEDLTQEAFVSAVEALARSADGAPPTLGWLYTVARRRLIDEARRRRPLTIPLEVVRDIEAPWDQYGADVARALESALVALTEAQRTVVVLRLLEGWSFAEIAGEVEATEEACRMRFMRGLEQLRTEFEKEGLNP
jgi:RNA polymerase sigma-70 factor (ECF subfamily)